MEESAAKAERDQYDMIARARGNAATRLKLRLHDYLRITGRDKVQTETGRTIAVVKNGGKAPLKVADSIDLDSLPPELVKVSKTLNNDAVRERLEAGESLPFASLAERGTSLRIR